MEPVPPDPEPVPPLPNPEPVPPSPATELVRPEDVVDVSQLQTTIDHAATALERVTVRHRGLVLADEALALKVVDAQTFTRSEQLYAALSAVESEIHKDEDGLIATAYKLWNGLTTRRKGKLDPIEQAKKHINAEAGAFKRAAEALAAAETRRLEAEAKAEQDRRLQLELDAAKARGDKQAVAEVKQEIKLAPPPAVFVPAAVPASTGATKKAAAEKWVVGVEDWPKLRKLIGEGKYPELDAALSAAVVAAVQPLAKTLKLTVKEKYPGLYARDESGAFAAKGTRSK